MSSLDDFVGAVVSRARIPRSSARADLERELRAHLEDAIEEATAEFGDKADASESARQRFGDREKIAQQLEDVYCFERKAMLAVDGLFLVSISILSVATVILLFQLTIAASIGIPPVRAFPRLRGEIVGFISLALGYMSLYLEERAVRRFRALWAFALNVAVFAGVFLLLSSVLHLRTLAPGIAFIAGAVARLLQNTSLRPFWYFGTLLPTAAACVSAGRLLSTGAETPLWAAVGIRWIGLTAACYSLTLLSRNHERRLEAVSPRHA